MGQAKVIEFQGPAVARQHVAQSRRGSTHREEDVVPDYQSTKINKFERLFTLHGRMPASLQGANQTAKAFFQGHFRLPA